LHDAEAERVLARHRLARLASTTRVFGRLARWLAKAPDTLGSGVRTARDLVRERRLGLLGAVAYRGFDIAVLGVCFHAFGRVVPVAVLVMGSFLARSGACFHCRVASAGSRVE
jgi:hypothetical protein